MIEIVVVFLIWGFVCYNIGLRKGIKNSAVIMSVYFTELLVKNVPENQLSAIMKSMQDDMGKTKTGG